MAEADRWDGLADSVVVLGETDSTQAEALRRDAGPGSVIITRSQIAGRGRLGRSWIAPADVNVAMTLVAAPGRPERLAVASAVAVAEAISALLAGAAEPDIKWPNDVLISGRKLAGILIEQDPRRARIGVGVNVLKRAWPEELAGGAVCLEEVGGRPEFAIPDCVIRLLASFREIWGWSDEALEQAFIKRDILVGQRAAFRRGDSRVAGIVKSVSPMRGLSVQTESGEIWLPAATTSVEESPSLCRYSTDGEPVDPITPY
jgi:BirA family biotin operon repressor/biotin-[acetyl-CoA-carboxylase] ligase